MHENRVDSMHARTISERKRRYFTEKCDNEPATGLLTRVISEMMRYEPGSLYIFLDNKKRCIGSMRHRRNRDVYAQFLE